MSKRSYIYIFIILLVFSLVFGTNIFAQEKQEIVVTIETISPNIDNPDFLKGEELRKQFKMNDAITEYQKVVNSDEPDEVKVEADYRIGICYTWMGKINDAESKFKEVLKTYPNHVNKVAASQYCLAWVEIQQGKFYQAIDRLQKTLDDNICKDEEICSKTQFQIGRIYLSFLNDYEKAKAAFSKVSEKYPESKAADHQFIKRLKSEETN